MYIIKWYGGRNVINTVIYNYNLKKKSEDLLQINGLFKN